jgi:hypothetical protein
MIFRAVLLFSAAIALHGANTPRTPLDPRGKTHIPIGIADTVDTLKTFVEAEGNFSPGFGSYGIYFWVWNDASNQLFAPTMDDVACEHGLAPGGLLIPWSRWKAGAVEVTTELCEVKHRSPASDVFVVGARVALTNLSDMTTKVSLFVAVRPLGAAGFDIREIGTTKLQLDVDGHVAVWASEEASAQMVFADDTVGAAALAGVPTTQPRLAESATSTNGNASGALRFNVALPPRGQKTFHFVCPVLPGRYAVRHQWDGVSTWAQFDTATLNPTNGSDKLLQPDPGEAWWAGVHAEKLFEEATAYWKSISQRATIRVPDSRWSESFAAIIAHSSLCMNEGAPDVAVMNYNVFNRDGIYMANIFQKSGNNGLSERAIDYFLSHPFNGRVQPEADNPGQILWVMAEHWKFTRDLDWLRRVYHGAQKLVAMIRYYRTTPGPHWVSDTSLNFGDNLPPNKRKELKPGACDGFHPEYTEAYDIAGLRQAALLAEALGNADDASAWRKLSGELLAKYEEKFRTNYARNYGSYCVLWPCALFSFNEGTAHQQFKSIGAQQPATWRYFPLAKAHQGVLAGNRGAAFETLNVHLDHPQMRGWFAFDEGGDSGVGGWNRVRTTWRRGKASDAMPHGWAIAEFVLLLRDALLFEDGDSLVLFAGVPQSWFTNASGMTLKNLPTHFGRCSMDYSVQTRQASLHITGIAPPNGIALRLPGEWNVSVTAAGRPVSRDARGDFLLPPGAAKAELHF